MHFLQLENKTWWGATHNPQPMLATIKERSYIILDHVYGLLYSNIAVQRSTTYSGFIGKDLY